MSVARPFTSTTARRCVACAYCGAGIGDRCRTLADRGKTNVHHARWMALAALAGTLKTPPVPSDTATASLMMEAFSGLTEAQHGHFLRNVVEAVVTYKSSGNTDALVRFADGLLATAELRRTTPSYRAAFPPPPMSSSGSSQENARSEAVNHAD